jgi:hypothetical protein
VAGEQRIEEQHGVANVQRQNKSNLQLQVANNLQRSSQRRRAAR